MAFTVVNMLWTLRKIINTLRKMEKSKIKKGLSLFFGISFTLTLLATVPVSIELYKISSQGVILNCKVYAPEEEGLSCKECRGDLNLTDYDRECSEVAGCFYDDNDCYDCRDD